MKNRITLFSGIGTVLAFVAWTAAVSSIDIRQIGPNGSSVGFAALNIFFHNLTGENMWLYYLTDWLSIVPILFIFGFGFLGCSQLIKRKSVFGVDKDILILGGFYIIVIMIYLFFEIYVVNYRPVLINGVLEPSYPSSTTLLVMSVMPTAALQLQSRTKNPVFRKTAIYAINIFTVFMIIGRLVSGVHWITDIIGGLILSAGLVMIYYSLTKSSGT